jgi:hypothetical protein
MRPPLFHWQSSTRRYIACAVLVLALAVMGIPTSVAFAQTGEMLLTKRATELKASPADTSATLAPLAAQASVTRLAGRQGPWVEVRSASGQTGWLHMFEVAGASATGGGSAASALRGISSFFGRSGTPVASNSGVTSTVGIRGLRAQDLAASQPNINAVLMMETLRLDANQARSFAAETQLQAQSVEPLPAPPPPANQTPSTDSNRDRF